MNADKIHKRALLKAPLERVWQAISDARQFGAWFRVALEGDFREGAHVRGRITHPGYEHLTADFYVEHIEAPHYFSYRWHPYAIDPTVDYSREPMTLVEFRLSEVAGGTELTITESGFERLPDSRRPEALRMNSEGWAAQLQNVEQHVTRS